MWWALLWSSGCSGDETSSPPPIETAEPTSETAVVDTNDTGEPPPPPPLTGACALSADNVLRASCDVVVDPPQAVEITFQPEDGSREARTHASEAVEAGHDLLLYFMRPETPYRYTIRALQTGEVLEGTFTTGTPPDGAQAVLTVEGTSTSPMVGVASPCGSMALIFDTAGDLLWYQDLAPSASFLEGVSFTEDRTVIGLFTGNLAEFDLEGRPGLSIDSADVGNRLHHDVLRKDGFTYVLFQEVYTTDRDYLMDGFYVFDEHGILVAQWHLSDHHEPTETFGGSGAIDYSHANALWLDDEGDIFVSFRHLSSFVKVAGLGRIDYGSLLWTVSGDTPPSLEADFELINPTENRDGFFRQHNVHQIADGRIAMFDNRTFGERSRLLVLEVDEGARTLTIDEVYDLNQYCDFQGSAWHTVAGNPVATCAPFFSAYEFTAGPTADSDAPESPVWEGEARCEQGSSPYIPRFVPLDW